MYRLYNIRGLHITLILESENIDEINEKMKFMIDKEGVDPTQLRVFTGLTGINPIRGLLGDYEI